MIAVLVISDFDHVLQAVNLLLWDDGEIFSVNVDD